jgi:hypothetical protein
MPSARTRLSKYGEPPAPSRKRTFGARILSGDESSLSSIPVEATHDVGDANADVHPADRTFCEALDAEMEETSDDDEDNEDDLDSHAGPVPLVGPLDLIDGLILCNLFKYPSHGEMTASHRIFEQFWKAGQEGLHIEE